MKKLLSLMCSIGSVAAVSSSALALSPSPAQAPSRATVTCAYGAEENGGTLKYDFDLTKSDAKISCVDKAACILDDPAGESMKLTYVSYISGNKRGTAGGFSDDIDKVYFSGGNGDDIYLDAVMQIFPQLDPQSHQTTGLKARSTITVMNDGELQPSSKVVECQATLN